jgi:hypothetical protein
MTIPMAPDTSLPDRSYQIVYMSRDHDLGVVRVGDDLVCGWSADPCSDQVHVLAIHVKGEWRGRGLVPTLEHALHEMGLI